MRVLTFMALIVPLAMTYNLVASAPKSSMSGFQVQFSWKTLDYLFPTEAHKLAAMASGNLIDNNGLLIDVHPHYSVFKQLRVFVTIPRFQGGIPFTLATISNTNSSNGPLLQPYPNYDAHNVNGDNCRKMTSVFRVAITKCNHLWVMDSGTVGTEGQCPPQLLLFDLNTDLLVHRFKFGTSLYTPRASLFVTPIAVVHDPPPSGICRHTMLYIADVSNHGLVVYDFRKNKAWRMEHPSMYPDPNYGTYTLAGESFTLMDGLFGMSTDKRKLFYHPLASITEYSVPLSVIDNSTNFANSVEAMPEAFTALGKRSSQCAAEAADGRGNVYCVTFNPIELIVWNVKSPYDEANLRKIPSDPKILEFVSGMKVVTNLNGLQELWMMSNRFQKVAAGTQIFNETNFRIVVYPLINTNVISQDLHSQLVFKG